MKHSIVVTRAPRMKLVRFAHMPLGTIFLTQAGWIRHKNADGDSCLDDSGEFKTPAWEDPLTYFAFEDWDAMCKWVNEGRNPADLQSDSKSEYAKFFQLERGCFFTYANGHGAVGMKTDTSSSVEIGAGGDSILHGHANNELVWPVNFGLGDTITITKGE